MMGCVPGRDTKTRFQGVYARHQQACAISARSGTRCSCSPTYWGKAWDRRVSKHRKTRRYPNATAARNARQDLVDALASGTLPAVASARTSEAIERFIQAAGEGVVLNKWGRRYRRRAVEDLESALRHVPEAIARRRLDDVRRSDVQALVDKLTSDGKSGSRVRSVVNALRSLYRWAQDRELASHDPAALVRLPAMNATPRDRVATPAEFTELLAALTPADPAKRPTDALPWALAGYGTARHQEIRTLDWEHVSFQLGAMELAADEEGRKPGGSWRVVPLVSPLLLMLKQEWMRQGRPKAGKVCPARQASRSGLISLESLQQHVHRRWRDQGLMPIGLHESRHTAATWLDHAGVSPKVASSLMGHTTPERQPGAAAITLQRYTHTLPGELTRARDQLERFLADRARVQQELFT